MIISRTPFRISFFGGGTDYPAWYEDHGGVVLSTTINKYAYITARTLPPFFNFKHRIQYYLKEEVNSLEEIKHPVVREAAKLLEIPNGLEIVHSADLPARSGLGSSSTFTVGLMHALFAMKNRMVTKRELAMSAINLEQNILGEAVGSQDQTAAAFGGFNLIEFSKNTIFQVQEVIISEERLKYLQEHLLLCFTGFSRSAEKVAKAQIKATPSKVNELNLMVEILNQAKTVLTNENNPIEEFGSLLNEQWHLKRSLTSHISNLDIDKIYNAGIEAGAIGGKLLGAGGGGFMLFFAKPEKHKKIKDSLKGKLFVPFRFEKTGSQIIYFSHD
ncbi:kinase [Alphaproteobacteria bacterium]|nr:kinase [Alphaproteobacteria bacterium]